MPTDPPDQQADGPTREQGPSAVFLQPLKTLVDAILHLYEFVPVYGGFVQALDHSTASPRMIISQLPLKEEEKQELEALWTELVSDPKMGAISLSVDTSDDAREEAEVKGPDDGAEAEVEPEEGDSKGTSIEMPSEVMEYLADHGAYNEFIRIVRRRQTERPGVKWFARSVITYAVSIFEASLSEFVSTYYQMHSRAAESGTKELSLADLLQYDSLSEAIDDVIDRRVRSVMYGSLDDWADWYKRQLGQDWRKFALGWDQTIELLQRRHVILHNDGRVSRQYLRNLPESFEASDLGTELPLGKSYVMNGLDRVLVLGSCAMLCGAAKVTKSYDDVGSAGIDLTYELLRHERWEACAAVASHLVPLAIKEGDRAYIQINGWIAEKESRGIEEIRRAVEGWDVSAASGVLQLAKAALLDRHDEVMSLVERQIEQHELSWESVKTWPLFKGFRSQEGFATFEEAIGIGSDAGESQR